MQDTKAVEKTKLFKLNKLIKIDEEDKLAESWVKENLLNIE